MPKRASLTYFEDLENPKKVLFPSRNLFLIALGKDEPKDCIPFTLFGDLPLDLHHGSVVDTSVSLSLSVWITGLAHVVRPPIASRTDWLSESNCLPFNLL